VAFDGEIVTVLHGLYKSDFRTMSAGIESTRSTTSKCFFQSRGLVVGILSAYISPYILKHKAFSHISLVDLHVFKLDPESIAWIS
jgi:hypothetical protein